MSIIERVNTELEDNFPDNVSVVVRSFSEDKPFKHRAFERYRAASLIKVPLAIALFDGIEKKKFNIYDVCTLDGEDKVYRLEDQNGEVDKAEIGTEFAIDFLVGEMLVKSDNSATNMLISYIGMDYVNTMLQEFAYVDTVLGRKMCDKHARAIGDENYTNASEMTQMFKDLHEGKILGKDKHAQHLLGMMAQSKFHSKITRDLPMEEEGFDVPRKGGVLAPYKDQPSVVHDVGLVRLPENPYVIGVFVEGVDSKTGSDYIAQVSKKVYTTIVSK